MTCLVKFLLMFSRHHASNRELSCCFSKKVFTAVASKKQQTSPQTYRAIFHFSHTVEREMPILPRLSPAPLWPLPRSHYLLWCGPLPGSQGISALASGAPPPLFLLSPLCPQGTFSHIFSFTPCIFSTCPTGIFPEEPPAWLLGSAVCCRGSAAQLAKISHAWHRCPLLPSQRPAPDIQYGLATTLLKQLSHTQKQIQVKRLPFKRLLQNHTKLQSRSELKDETESLGLFSLNKSCKYDIWLARQA